MLKLCNGCRRAFPQSEIKRGRCRNCKVRNYDGRHRRVRKQAIAAQPYCTDCGATEDLCADHITPYSEGGSHVLSNYEVRCRSCNTRRRNEELSW
jgi:5-methylcytosine-specific restriction endonuclease McrA